MFDSVIQLWHENPVAQSIGFLGMLAGLLSFHGKTPKAILRLQTVAATFWTLHFILLGRPAGAALNFLAIFRNVVFSRRGHDRWAASAAWPFVFATLFALSGFYSGIVLHEGWRSALSTAAQCLACFVLVGTRPQAIRVGSIAVSALWLVYDFLSGSIPGVLCEIAVQISIYIALFQNRRKAP